jgi:hypothetical protein
MNYLVKREFPLPGPNTSVGGEPGGRRGKYVFILLKSWTWI